MAISFKLKGLCAKHPSFTSSWPPSQHALLLPKLHCHPVPTAAVLQPSERCYTTEQPKETVHIYLLAFTENYFPGFVNLEL